MSDQRTWYQNCRVVGARLGQTPAKGTPYLSVTFAVPNVGERSVSLWLTEKAMANTEEKLEQLGFNGDVEHPQFSNPIASLSCEPEEYNGKKVERWQIGRGDTPLGTDEAAAIAARFRARFGGSVNGTASAPRAAAPPSVPPRPVAAPARSAGPPKADDFGKNQAWDAWVKESPNGDVNADLFYKTIDDVRGKIPESEMTADQWRQVATAFVPF